MGLNDTPDGRSPTDHSPGGQRRIGTAGPALQAAIERISVRWPAVVLGVAAVPFALGVSVPLWVQFLPLVASGVVLGMPHGAVDHLVPARLGEYSTRRGVVVVVVVYALLGGGYLAAWFLAPVAAAVAFVVVTWFHWGQGDVYPLAAASAGDYPRSSLHRGLVIATRGAMPMLVPLVAFPDQYRRVVGALVGLFGADVAPIAGAFTPAARTAVGAAVALLVGATLMRGAFAQDPEWGLHIDRGFRTDAVETLLLGGYFLVVPPILAVGLYFCVWHSLRHVVRLLATDPAGAKLLRTGRPWLALARFGREAAPTTAIALAILGVVYPLVPRAPATLESGVALYLVVVAALTLPHVAVVTWMDRRQFGPSAGQASA